MNSVEQDNAPPVQEESKSAPSNLTVRTRTAIALLPPLIIGLIVGGVVLTIMVIPVVALGLLEFYALTQKGDYRRSAITGILTAVLIVIGFYLDEPALWIGAFIAGIIAATLVEFDYDANQAPRRIAITIIGICYIAFPAAFLIATRNFENGLLWTFIIFIGTFSADTFAYFGGRFWGKHKLAPRISPKKTVEGAIAGVIGGVAIPALILLVGDEVATKTIIMILFLPLAAIIGDLLESALKRHYGVKDSFIPGLNVIPGHGGVLDRIDALLLVAAYVFLFLEAFIKTT
jgi:phosphatidate cytidylyltransferase